PEDPPWAGGTADFDGSFDSARFPGRFSDDPGPTYPPAPAAPAKPTPAPASAPVPTTKPPFKDDGSL
ncbi:protoheme IX synthesis protein, partial [Achromobacter sp. LC458]